MQGRNCPFGSILNALGLFTDTLTTLGNIPIPNKNVLPYNKTIEEIRVMFAELTKLPISDNIDKKSTYKVVHAIRDGKMKSLELTKAGGDVFENILQQHNIIYNKGYKDNICYFGISDTEMKNAAILWFFAIEAVDSVLSNYSQTCRNSDEYYSNLPSAIKLLIRLSNIPGSMQSYITANLDTILKNNEGLQLDRLFYMYGDTKINTCPAQSIIPGLAYAVAHLYVPTIKNESIGILQRIRIAIHNTIKR